MPSITINNVPEELLQRLRARAQAHRRSLDAELLTILERAVSRRGRLSIEELRARIDAVGFPPRDEAAEVVRSGRDARAGR